MERRGFFKSTLAAIAGLAAGGAARAASPNKQKVAYHLADADKVRFVLNNIQNHIAGVGGPENVEIVLVVHGPALKSFNDIASDAATKDAVAKLRGGGVALNACGNTMREQKVELSDLIPGFVRVDQGGVVRLAQLQGEGYVYLRP
jgi:intracellular sulfur oxidation DsrE/DsrF family protein